MTATQLQRLLDSAGLSQRGAAKAIGISERHMRRYVAGEAEVPLVVEFALRWVIHRTRVDGSI
jgi:transcriptional regulator with XRE-family HTH domain